MSNFTSPQWEALRSWFARHGRALPWRTPGTTAWGVLVSEVMLHQTPVSRVVEPWGEWLRRWPTPAAMAAASPAEALRMWGRLGYPRRALRLREAASAMVRDHAGRVPDSESELLALPGVGRYTAAAVVAFAHRRRSLVLDTNVRRVLARHDRGCEGPPRTGTTAERTMSWAAVPPGDDDAADWSAAVMELGALVCTARRPACGECPVSGSCAWLAAGRPAAMQPRRRAQAWAGTDRQCRGRVMAALREAEGAVAVADVPWPDPAQRLRCAESLVADGLAQRPPADGSGGLRLILPS